jgi:hypothetical protein
VVRCCGVVVVEEGVCFGFLGCLGGLMTALGRLRGNRTVILEGCICGAVGTLHGTHSPGFCFVENSGVICGVPNGLEGGGILHVP